MSDLAEFQPDLIDTQATIAAEEVSSLPIMISRYLDIYKSIFIS